MKCINQEVADRFNELEIPPEVFATKKMQREFNQWQRGRRLLIVIDMPNGSILTAFKKLKF